MMRVNIKNFNPRTVRSSWDDNSWTMRQGWCEASEMGLLGSGDAEMLIIINKDFSVSLSEHHLQELKTLLLMRA